jgi:hypothetical protein
VNFHGFASAKCRAKFQFSLLPFDGTCGELSAAETGPRQGKSAEIPWQFGGLGPTRGVSGCGDFAGHFQLIQVVFIP